MLEGIDDLENIPPYALPEPKRLNVGGLLTRVSAFYAEFTLLLNRPKFSYGAYD